MAERRSLIEGIKPASNVDPSLEKEFVYGDQAKPNQTKPQPTSAPASEAGEGKGQTANAVSRVALNTRIKTNIAAALKRASLERQLKGEVPNKLQDILEQALEPWLRSNGYLN
jgi:hypothetical protein